MKKSYLILLTVAFLGLASYWVFDMYLFAEGVKTDAKKEESTSGIVKKRQSSPSDDEKKTLYKCDCEGLVDWQKEVKIALYDFPNGSVIDSLSHDTPGENFLVFTILDATEDLFKVNIGRALDNNHQTGWIEKNESLGTYARNYSEEDTLFLFSQPNTNSLPVDSIFEYYPELCTISNCSGKWAEVNLNTINKDFQGWLDPALQCPSPYTTCN